jgi:hypothetical protein
LQNGWIQIIIYNGAMKHGIRTINSMKTEFYSSFKESDPRQNEIRRI